MDFTNIFSFNNLVFFIILLVVLFASFKYGRKVCISLILATYPTILIFRNLDFIQAENATTSLILLGVVYILSLAILWINLNPHNSHNTARKIIDYVLLSLSFMILLASTSANAINVIAHVINFGPISTIVNSYIPFGFALIIPIIVILITNKRPYR